MPAPDFLNYSPADIAAAGRERGLPPERIAQAVTRHRDTLAAYGQQTYGERFQAALPRLQQDTNAVLEEIKPGLSQVDPAILNQGPAGTFVNELRNIGPQVLNQTVGGAAKLQETMGRSPLAALAPLGMLNRAGELITGRNVLGTVADTTQALQEEGERQRPSNPFNPTAKTIGGAINQVGGMLATGGAAGMAGMAPATAGKVVPMAYGLLAGAGSGIDTARAMGITSPTAQAGMGMAFGGVEALTERLGGIGGDVVNRFINPASFLGKGALNTASEAVEEILAGRAQDALTVGAGQFVSDPSRPGYTRSGYKLPSLNPLNPETLAKMRQEAIGGAAGGAVFTGIQALSPNDPLSPDQTPAPGAAPRPPGTATAQMGSPAAAPLTPLTGIAERGGRIDPTLPDDTGALTADEVADLEQGVGQAMSDPSPTDASVTKGSGPTADQTAQQAPGAGSSPAAGTRAPGGLSLSRAAPLNFSGMMKQTQAVATGQQQAALPQALGGLMNPATRPAAPAPAGPGGTRKGLGALFQHSPPTPARTRPESEPVSPAAEAIMSAYKKLRQEGGFKTVKIARLQQLSGVPLEQLHEFIRSAARAGQALPSGQDVSIANDESKAAAIEYPPNLGSRGQPVRFMNVDLSDHPAAAGKAVDMATAYAAATQGSSTQMVPIRAVYEQARAQDPTLTPEAFMQAVQAGDNNGSIFLEPPERQETIAAAGPFALRNASGIVATNMMVAPGPPLTSGLSRGVSAMASNSRAAQNAEPSPGGLSEAEVRFVASKGEYKSTPPIPFYTASNEGYARNFGENVIRVAVTPKNTLDLSSIPASSDDGGQRLKEELQNAGIKLDGATIWKDDELAQALNRNLKLLSDRIAAAGYDSVRLNEYVADGGSDISLLIVSKEALSPESSRAAGGTLGASPSAEPSPGGLSEAEVSNFPQLSEVVSRALAESSVLNEIRGDLVNQGKQPGSIPSPIALHVVQPGFNANRVVIGPNRALVLITGENYASAWQSQRLFRAFEEKAWPYGSNKFLRVTHNKADYDHLKAGTHRGSINRNVQAWEQEKNEGGLSVAYNLEVPAKYAYFVEGEKIGTGEDGEPLLDLASAKPVGALLKYETASERLKADQSRHLLQFGFSPRDIARAANSLKQYNIYGIETIDGSELPQGLSMEAGQVVNKDYTSPGLEARRAEVERLRKIVDKQRKKHFIDPAYDVADNPESSRAAGGTLAPASTFDAPLDNAPDAPSSLFTYDARPTSDLTAQERDALRVLRDEYRGSSITPVRITGLQHSPDAGPRASETRARQLAQWSQSFVKLFGKRVLFFDGPNTLNGAVADGQRNVIMVNVNGPDPLLYILGHELTHSLKAQDPTLYAALEAEMLASGQNLDSYREKLLALGYEPDKLNEEMLADFVGSQFLEPDFLNRLAAEKPSLFERFAQAVVKFLNTLLRKSATLTRDIRPHFDGRLTGLRDTLVQALKTYSESGQFPDNPLVDNLPSTQADTLSASETTPNETQSRFASPNAADRVINGPRTDAMVAAEAQAWLNGLDPLEAIEAFRQQAVPLPLDAAEHAAGLLLSRLSEQASNGKTEVQRMWAHVQGQRMAPIYTKEFLSADPARGLRQRGVVNNTILAPIAPVLAAQELLTDRATKVIDARFDGGAEGVTEKIKDVVKKADEQAGTELAGQLEGTPAAPELGDNPEAGGQAKPNTKPRDKAKETPKEREARVKVNKAQRTAQSILDELSRRYADPPIFAEGQRVVNAMRELYKERVKTGMSETEFVRRAVELGANEGTAGILWEASKLEIEAREIIEREKLREPLSKLLESNSPALAKLLNALRKKMFPGMTWADIFTQLPSAQKERQREIYRRLMLDERLQQLTADERLALTNELDKAWMRERRKVFLRELEKAKVLGEKKPKDRDKVKAAAPRLLRLMNLGMLNSDMFREALAQEYGLKMIDATTAAELRALGERIQQAPEGLPRRKLEQRLIERLQSLAGRTLWQTLDSYWTASVLSGWRTQVDIGLSLANGIEDVGLGSLVTALRTGNKDVALRGLGNLFARIPSAFLEAVDHVKTGNKSMMRNFELEMKQALEGGNRMASDVGMQMWRDGGWRKVPGGFMIFYGRLLTALDHVNSASTREGALAMALARHPELYQKALRITATDRAAARQQARLELTGGTQPTTQQERLEESARVREILEQGTPTEVLDEATDIGRRAALQGEPTGLGGGLLDAVLAAVGVVSRKAESMGKRDNLDATSKQVLKLLQGSAPLARAITGTKFARTVAHALNRTLSYVPGVGMVAVGQQGRTGAFGDILAARQVIGTLVGIALYLAFDDDDDEKGIEDGWKDKTPQQKAQLYAQGKQPFTIWERDSQGRVRSYNYQQWGLAGIINTTAAMLKQKDSEQGAVNVLMSSLVQGAMSFTDKAQLQGLQTVFGENYRSTDPASGIAANLNKWAAQSVGGLIPRLVKDIDQVSSPELRTSADWWQKWAKEVPLLRQMSSGKRVDIFGEDIKLDRTPLSRVTLLGTADPAYRTLGKLNEKDIYLPDPGNGVRVVKLADGTRRSMSVLEKDRYQRLTGAAYKDYIMEHGTRLLQLEPDAARDEISRVTKRMRDRAAYTATH